MLFWLRRYKPIKIYSRFNYRENSWEKQLWDGQKLIPFYLSNQSLVRARLCLCVCISSTHNDDIKNIANFLLSVAVHGHHTNQFLYKLWGKNWMSDCSSFHTVLSQILLKKSCFTLINNPVSSCLLSILSWWISRCKSWISASLTIYTAVIDFIQLCHIWRKLQKHDYAFWWPFEWTKSNNKETCSTEEPPFLI